MILLGLKKISLFVTFVSWLSLIYVLHHLIVLLVKFSSILVRTLIKSHAWVLIKNRIELVFILYFLLYLLQWHIFFCIIILILRNIAIASSSLLVLLLSWMNSILVLLVLEVVCLVYIRFFCSHYLATLFGISLFEFLEVVTTWTLHTMSRRYRRVQCVLIWCIV